MLSDPFRRMRHDHWFDADDAGTKMRGAFEFSTMAAQAPLDSFVLGLRTPQAYHCIQAEGAEATATS